MGKRWSREKGSFWKHLRQEHECQCGRVIRGNGFYNHIKNCEPYKIWRANKYKEFCEYMTAKGFLGYKLS